MGSQRRIAIVTGASQGIGAGLVRAIVERGFDGDKIAALVCRIAGENPRGMTGRKSQ